jgi:hypothetical protein
MSKKVLDITYNILYLPVVNFYGGSMPNNTYLDLLNIFESLLRSQLNAIRQLKKGTTSSDAEPVVEKRRSQMSIVYDILKLAQKPMHVSDILTTANQRFGIELDRESVVSALTKRVKRQDRFLKTGPNTFALIDQTPAGQP